MKINKLFGLLGCLTLLNIAPNALAATGYIIDEIYVPLRAGQGNQYKILNKGLRSGTALKIIEENDGSEWMLVETKGGVQGWIRSQYVQKEPTAELKLADITRRLAEKNDKYADTKSAYQELQDKNSELEASLAEATANLQTTTEELNELKKISGDAVALHQRHQEFMEKYEVLKTELDIKVGENERLRKDDRRSWFIYGAGAVGFGVFLTLIIPLFRRKKRYSEWAN